MYSGIQVNIDLDQFVGVEEGVRKKKTIEVVYELFFAKVKGGMKELIWRRM